MVGIKENFLRVFTWLIFLPCMSALAWYGLYKLIRWLFGGQKEIKKRYNSGGCEMGICQGYNVVGFRVFILSLCYNGLGFMKLGIENQTINEIGKLLVIALSYLFSNGLYHIYQSLWVISLNLQNTRNKKRMRKSQGYERIVCYLSKTN